MVLPLKRRPRRRRKRLEIDDEVYKALQDEAEPFVETTPNDVLRRILLGTPGKDTDAKRLGALRRSGSPGEAASQLL
ncbi:hypothetical protein FLW53_21965 [Microbispora sp. SCL1-1]|uniref:hypothetical protein n=1 Tax=unclassified Microbispora TaxID=2614687 RepID=UPI001159F337|nr:MULTISPECIES: hypothetical protein [unclassified Microbispora]NJP26807.1 hypothetical protein [Microbispora sp. CL1-1]TQS12001.1 hypothetical protein FLW53_21965 [Microbispora sp. SCL1-1]